MTEKRLKYLSDIIHAIELIEEFTSSISTYLDYESDLKTQSAVERQLAIIGEAVNKLEILHPDIQLQNSRKIIGLRNRLVHAYDSIDPTMVWVILALHIVPLKKEVSDLMI